LHGVEIGLINRSQVGTLTAQLLPGGERALRQVHEPWPRRPGQGDRKIVGHDGLIFSYSEDRGGVDLQEFSKVNYPIVLLRQMGPELAQLDQHPEMWCKRHTLPRACCRARGTHNTRRKCLSCWCKRFKISLKVTTPFTMALDGDATILSPVMADELITEVGHRDAWQHARLMRHACRWQCTRS
jgi:hypothetical protein